MSVATDNHGARIISRRSGREFGVGVYVRPSLEIASREI